MFIYVKDYMADGKMMFIKEKLRDADDSVFQTLLIKKFHYTTHIILFSVFLGFLGADRFMIGDTGLGVAKLILNIFTCGI